MRGAILLGALLLAAPTAARTPMAWPGGTYGNVRTHEETGDMLGMEARFFEVGGRHLVEFVWCEGWCNDVYVLPVTRTARGFTFHLSQALDGGAKSSRELHFVAWRAGGRLLISAWEGRGKIDEERLRPLKKPSAIPFAKVNGAR